MKKYMTPKIGITILRLALAFVFLWFGFSQLSDMGMWISFVPEWLTNMTGFGAGMFVLFNGIFEIIAGGMLAFGVFTRIVAIILGLHLLLISLSLGFNAVGVRDFGLAFATISLGFLGGGEFVIRSEPSEIIK